MSKNEVVDVWNDMCMNREFPHSHILQGFSIFLIISLSQHKIFLLRCGVPQEDSQDLCSTLYCAREIRNTFESS